MSLSGEIDPAVRATAIAVIEEHLHALGTEPWVQQVESDRVRSRWYFRFGCDGRDAATIAFDLHERTLQYELYFLPAFEGDQSGLHRWLLQKNEQLAIVHFSMSADGDVYLRGRWPLEHLDPQAMETIVGALYQTTEGLFGAALTLAKPAAAVARRSSAESHPHH